MNLILTSIYLSSSVVNNLILTSVKCASAIRWAGFREYIYGTSIDTLVQSGWGQIHIASVDVFKASSDLGTQTRLLGDVLANETDPFFLWQFDPEYPCPVGCSREESGSGCRISTPRRNSLFRF